MERIFGTLDDGRRIAFIGSLEQVEAVIGKLMRNADPRIATRDISVAEAAKAVAFTLSQSRVSDAVREAREATCATCEHIRQTPEGQKFCGLCKCNIQNPVFNLAALVESKDQHGNVTSGCKHPERSQGKGWRE